MPGTRYVPIKHELLDINVLANHARTSPRGAGPPRGASRPLRWRPGGAQQAPSARYIITGSPPAPDVSPTPEAQAALIINAADHQRRSR